MPAETVRTTKRAALASLFGVSCNAPRPIARFSRSVSPTAHHSAARSDLRSMCRSTTTRLIVSESSKRRRRKLNAPRNASLSARPAGLRAAETVAAWAVLLPVRRLEATLPPAMRFRAIAMASERSNAVGTVELECAPVGLSLVYLGVGGFSDGYVPTNTADNAKLTVPWPELAEASVDGEQV